MGDIFKSNTVNPFISLNNNKNDSLNNRSGSGKASHFHRGDNKFRGSYRGDNKFRGYNRGRGVNTIRGSNRGDNRFHERGNFRGKQGKRGDNRGKNNDYNKRRKVDFKKKDNEQSNTTIISTEVPINNPLGKKRKFKQDYNKNYKKEKKEILTNYKIKSFQPSKKPKKQQNQTVTFINNSISNSSDTEDEIISSTHIENTDYSSNSSEDSEEYNTNNSTIKISFNPKDILNENETEKPPKPFINNNSPIIQQKIRRSLRNMKDTMPDVRGSTFIPIQQENTMKISNPTIWNISGDYSEIINEAAETYIKGECNTMCSEQEFNKRKQFNDFSVFELDPQTKQASLNTAIAEYTRVASDRENVKSKKLRTPEAIQKSIDYILLNIVDLPPDKYTIEDKSTFILNRFRAIHAEVRIQRIYTPYIARMLEQMVRFYIILSYRCRESKIVQYKELEEGFINSYSILNHIYPELHKRNIFSPNEAEMHSYYILWNYKREMGYISKYKNILSSQPIKLVMEISNSLLSSNYIKFFHLLHSVPLLYSCLMFIHVHNLRINALNIIRISTFKGRIAINDLVETLCFDNENQCIAFLDQFEVFPNDNNDNYVDLKHIIKLPEPKLYSSHWLDTQLSKYTMYHLAVHCNFIDNNNTLYPQFSTVKEDTLFPVNKEHTNEPKITIIEEDIPEPIEKEQENIIPDIIIPPKKDKETDNKKELEQKQKQLENDKQKEKEEKLKMIKKQKEFEKEQIEYYEKQHREAKLRLCDQLNIIYEEMKEYIEYIEQEEIEKENNKLMKNKVEEFIYSRPKRLKKEIFTKWRDYTKQKILFRKSLNELHSKKQSIMDTDIFNPHSSNIITKIPELSLSMTLQQIKYLIKPIFIPSIIGNILKKRNPNQKNIYWKMSLSTCPYEELYYHKHIFNILEPINWIKEKLKYPKNSIPLEESLGISLFSFYEQILSNNERYKIACNWIDLSTDNISYDILYSTQSLIYIVNNYNNLEEQKLYLLQFLELHDNSFLKPLSIINVSQYKNNEINSIFQMNTIYDNYYHIINSWQIIALPIDEYSRIQMSASNILENILKWQAQMIIPQPQLQCIKLLDLIDKYTDNSIFLLFNKYDENKHIHPSTIINMYKRALRYTYLTILNNIDISLDWPIREFIQDNKDKDNIHPFDNDFDPDIHGGYSYYNWNTKKQITKLYSELQLLNLPNIPDNINLCDYYDISTCVIQYIEYCFKDNEIEKYNILEYTKNLLKQYLNTKIFKWNNFLYSIFHLKCKNIESSIYFYKGSLDIIDILQYQMQENDKIKINYQYKNTINTDIDDIIIENDINIQNNNSLQSLYDEIESSPPYKKQKITMNTEDDIFWNLVNEIKTSEVELNEELLNIENIINK